ncbi:DUF805 domain-containing protein [Methylobacterium sp. 17Sr1-1]|uniref:DUF805 domain-containing protein n=1 Tax=Methylobacterium sp. 17Sr1-1 TaxID=2202826 RepID=UPI000D6F8931|nr:DUF805 domain-containing protein [Methylobacterium sp. 17Sr1-1]AWN54471.1 DUF805 domain-containing protein [Methylobacterium sp. 17Sr1-1]
MRKLLFTIEGRIPRSQYWLAMLIYIGVAVAAALVAYLPNSLFPGTVGESGDVTVTGIAALPYILLSLGYAVLSIWSGICVNAKRCHDRGRSGWFQLIIFIPIIGQLWYMIESGFLRGTRGPNPFGPDPRDVVTAASPLAASA